MKNHMMTKRKEAQRRNLDPRAQGDKTCWKSKSSTPTTTNPDETLARLKKKTGNVLQSTINVQAAELPSKRFSGRRCILGRLVPRRCASPLFDKLPYRIASHSIPFSWKAASLSCTGVSSPVSLRLLVCKRKPLLGMEGLAEAGA